MKKGLRSRLAQYGDEDFAFFLRRGFLKGAGFTDDALDLPIVGILSTASDFNPCHKTAPQEQRELLVAVLGEARPKAFFHGNPQARKWT